MREILHQLSFPSKAAELMNMAVSVAVFYCNFNVMDGIYVVCLLLVIRLSIQESQ